MTRINTVLTTAYDQGVVHETKTRPPIEPPPPQRRVLFPSNLGLTSRRFPLCALRQHFRVVTGKARARHSVPVAGENATLSYKTPGVTIYSIPIGFRIIAALLQRGLAVCVGVGKAARTAIDPRWAPRPFRRVPGSGPCTCGGLGWSWVTDGRRLSR